MKGKKVINFGIVSRKQFICQILSKKGARAYFTGIGGVSMSALALLLKSKGIRVFGSDLRRSEITDMLQKRGIGVRFTHTKEGIMSFAPDIAVFSLSIDKENPEYRAAVDMKIPIISRAELLGALMDDYEVKLGVSGSHGKSTVTAMIGSVLEECVCNPTVLCGAQISETYGLKQGGEKYLVYESCEYGDSFLQFTPDVQLLLNLELDHTDYFKSEEAIRESFLKSANTAKNSCVLNLDSENLALIRDRIKTEVHAYSSNKGAEYRYEIKNKEKAFNLYKKERLIGEYRTRLKGVFNIENSVAAAVLADVLELPYDKAALAINNFNGIKRRLEHIKKIGSVSIFYDYAHHPTEIDSVNKALRAEGYKNIAVVFAPHTYSRTSAFFEKFAKSLANFNTVYIAEIYGAREKAVVGVNSSSLADAVIKAGGSAHAVSESESASIVSDIIGKSPDCVVLMGAGNLDNYKEAFMKI